MYYGFVANNETKDNLKNLQQKIRPTYKHAFHLPVTAANYKMCIPQEYGGYGMDDMFIERLRIQSSFAVQHIHNSNSVGKDYL